MIKEFEEISVQLGKKFKNLVVLGSDSPKLYGIDNFSKYFDERCFSFGLGYANMLSAASGFTVRGKMPMVVLSADSVIRTIRQIRDNICKPNLNVKIVAIDFTGSSEDIEFVKALPNIKIFEVNSAHQLEDSLLKATDEFGPCYIRISI